MDTNNKKISFGFSKAIKKPNLMKPVVKQEKSIQLIECLEGQCIKVIGEEKEEKRSLVIPLKQKELFSKEKVKGSEKKNDFISNLEQSSNNAKAALSLDELAAQELLNDIKNSESKNEEKNLFSINMIENKNILEGEKESTIEDYENIPVHDFGFAMLRGMGWEEGKGIGKNKKIMTTVIPVVRPKGMGLGADKIVKLEEPTVIKDENNENLQIIKGAYVKLLAGRFKDMYGQIEGLDDESGRLIVKMTLDGNNISVNEFVVTSVTKDEYNKNSRVINSSKYEEYKKRTDTINKSYSIKENKPQIKPNRTKEYNERFKTHSSSKEHSTTESHKLDEKKGKYSEKNEDCFHKSTSRHSSSRNAESNLIYSNRSGESKTEPVVISSSESENEKCLEKNRSFQRHHHKKSDSETSSDKNEKKHKHKKQKKKKHKHSSRLKKYDENDDKKYSSSKRKYRHRSRSRTRS